MSVNYDEGMLALVFSALINQGQLANDVTKGLHLYRSCQAAVRMSNNPETVQARAELASSTYCFGYLGGYIDAVNRLKPEVCLRNTSLNAVARVYVAFMDANPKLLDENRAFGVLLATKNAYTCRVR